MIARVELTMRKQDDIVFYTVRPLYPNYKVACQAWYDMTNEARLAAGRYLFSEFQKGNLIGVWKPKEWPVQYAIRMRKLL